MKRNFFDRLKTFWLVLNESCNNRCLFCYAKKSSHNFHLSFSPNYARKVIDMMAKQKVKKCLLIGGEPTLYPQLFFLISYLKKNKIKSVLITNGRLLANKSFVKRLKFAGLGEVIISIEGPNPTIQNKITQSSSFNQTLKGIRNSLEENLALGTLTTINTLNKDYLLETASLLHKLGVKNIAFNCAIPILNQDGTVESKFVPHPKETVSVIEYLYAKTSSKKIKININGTIPICLFRKPVLRKMLEDKTLSVGCQMYLGQGVAFDARGDIFPCTHFTNFPLIKNFGQKSIKTKNTFPKFMSLWKKDPSVISFRQELWRYPVIKCKKCLYWGACIGGCPILWLTFSPKKIII